MSNWRRSEGSRLFIGRPLEPLFKPALIPVSLATFLGVRKPSES